MPDTAETRHNLSNKTKAQLIEELENLRRQVQEPQREAVERHRAEGLLEESKAAFRSMIDHFPGEIFVKDREGRYLLINQEYDRRYGMSLEHAKGKTMVDFFPQEVVDPNTAAFRQVIETGEAVTIEEQLHYGETNHTNLLVQFPIQDEAGDVIAVGGIGTDITEQKEAEEQIRKLNDELERRVEERTTELRATQADLLRQERLATLGQLTATVSHELRNPLGVIQTSTCVVRDNLNDCDPRVGRSLERIERSVIRCDHIIEELLDYTRIRQLEPEPTPIDTWLEGVLEEQTLHTNITLRRELGLPGVKVFLDQDRFRRAVINVFDNACQAMVGDGNGKIEEGEHILTIQTGKTNGRIEVVFEDNGPGIPPDVLPEVFEPMFSTKGFGVGLGLPVVKQIMEQHGGGIEIESEEGRGTRAILWLPANKSVS
jgi:PAS domain S-box-containing protein